MAAEVAHAFVSLAPSARGWSGKIESQIGGEVTKSGSKLGGFLSGAMKKTAIGGALAVGTAVGATVYGGFKSAIQQQNSQKVLAGLYGSAKQAQATLAGLNRVASASPLGHDAFRKGAESLAYAGVQGNKAVGILKNVGLAITAAGGSGENMGQATDAILKMVNAGKVQLDTLQQLSNSGVPILSGLAKHFGTSIAEVNEMASAGKIDITDVMDVMAKAQGKTFQSMKKAGKAASQSFGNQWKIAKDNVVNAVGAHLIPLLDKVAPAIGKIGQAAPRVIDGIASVFGKVAPVVGKVVTTIGGYVKGLFASFSGGGGVSSLAATFVGFGSSLAKNFGPVLKTIAATVTNVILPAITSLATYVASKLMPVFTAAFGVITTKVVPILASLAGFIYGQVYPAIVQIVTAVAKQLKPVFDQLVKTFKDSILPTISKLLDKFHEIQPTLQKVILVVVKVIGFVLKLAAVILGKVLPVLIRLAGWIISKLVGALSTIIVWVVKVIGKVVDWGSAIAKFIGGAKDKFNTLVGFVKSLPGRIGRAAKGMWDGIKNAFKAAINWIIRAWNGLSFKLPSVDTHIPGVGKIGGFTLGTPHIPELAKGGIVTKPTLALIGEAGPEAVVPLSGRNTPGGVNVYIDKVEPADYRDLMRQIQTRADRTSMDGVRRTSLAMAARA